MPRKKSNKFIGCFKIFFSSIKTYFMYFDECIKALAFPIFGQLLSTIFIFTITYFFTINIDRIKNINDFFSNDTHLLILFLIIILPFLIVLLKAVYDYLIAFSSLNLLFYTASKKKKSKNVDLNANNNVIQRKLFQYILLLLFVSLMLIFPPLILGLFLCLAFQVFAFEGEISAPNAISRSFELIKSNILGTILLLLLCYISTYWFLPSLFIWFTDKISVSYFFVNLWEDFFSLLPLNSWNETLSSIHIKYTFDAISLSKIAFEACIAFIIVGFTLPFRCCCFTELYRLYDSDKIKEISKSSEDIISRATKKGKN